MLAVRKRLVRRHSQLGSQREPGAVGRREPGAATIDRDAVDVLRPGPTADPVTRLEDHNRPSLRSKDARGCQPGEPRADNADVRLDHTAHKSPPDARGATLRAESS